MVTPVKYRPQKPAPPPEMPSCRYTPSGVAIPPKRGGAGRDRMATTWPVAASMIGSVGRGDRCKVSSTSRRRASGAAISSIT